MLLLIMCELKSPAAFASIRETVEVFGPTCNFYDNFFVVSTDKSPDDLKGALCRLADGQSIIFVGQVKQEYVDYLPKEIREWVSDHRDVTVN